MTSELKLFSNEFREHIVQQTFCIICMFSFIGDSMGTLKFRIVEVDHKEEWTKFQERQKKKFMRHLGIRKRHRGGWALPGHMQHSFRPIKRSF